jgi:hypothetical protein
MTDPCQWEQSELGQWDTSCGNEFEFMDDGPFENGFKHCPYCGKQLTEKPFTYEDERDDSNK